jgi:hypothetical protein
VFTCSGMASGVSETMPTALRGRCINKRAGRDAGDGEPSSVSRRSDGSISTSPSPSSSVSVSGREVSVEGDGEADGGGDGR